MSAYFDLMRRELAQKGFSKGFIDNLELILSTSNSAKTTATGTASDVATLLADVAALQSDVAAAQTAADDAALLQPNTGISPGDVQNIVTQVGGTPGGTSGQVQYNNGGAFGGGDLSGDVSTSGSLVTAIGANKVTNAMLRQSGALAVVGRSANSTGNVADIQATAASDAVFRESGGALGFGTVATGGIANAAVTLAKIANASAGSKVLGATGSGASYTELALTAGSGVAISWGAGGPTFSVTGGAGGVGMIFVASATVSGSAATTLTISGLDLNSDGRYFIIISLKNATTSTFNVSLYYNSDTTATNYDRVTVTGAGTVTGSRANTAEIIGMDSNTAATGSGDSNGYGWISFGISGRPLALVQSVRSGNGAMTYGNFAHEWRTSGTNVTGITLSSSVASALAVGSKVEIWKMST